MIKIAFCDDEVSILNELGAFIDKYRVEKNMEIEYVSLCSPLELMNEIERGSRFDIIFLDVIMPGETGIDTAKEIRSFDNNVKIIFLTSSSEYAVDSYSVSAYFYQLKPIVEESFFGLMDSVVLSVEKERTNSIVLRSKDGIKRINLNEIEYCEVVHRTLFIHLADGKTLQCSGSLDDFSKQLEMFGGFLRIHRSYLINLEYVKQLTYQAVTMACMTRLPIPRGKYQEVKDIYLEYMFRNRQVII